MKANEQYAIYSSVIGKIKIAYTDTAVISLDKIEDNDYIDIDVKSPLSDLAFSQLDEYFHGKRKEFDFPLEMRGTEFQKKVWMALCDIPYGETRTYKEIAILVGNPKASRAVGMANNKNPIAIAVPCHRVIGSNGKLVGYAGGLEMKTALLDIEKKNK
ncbi:MAG: methylated-DNA--[protein]-cysteine S-methyltransferase [Clostridiales bacterium]|nr:methylated-DNA--[protein]-cysteine S-methyltransferase [Clostridiales bacterium]